MERPPEVLGVLRSACGLLITVAGRTEGGSEDTDIWGIWLICPEEAFPALSRSLRNALERSSASKGLGDSLSLLVTLKQINSVKCLSTSRASARKQRFRIVIELVPPGEES